MSLHASQDVLIKKMQYSTRIGEDVEKLEPSNTTNGNETMQSHWITARQFVKVLSIELSRG